MLVNGQWRALFYEVKVSNLIAFHSNHLVIFLEAQVWRVTQYPRRFGFENAWLREASCAQIVNSAWNNLVCEYISDYIHSCASFLQIRTWSINQNYTKRLKLCLIHLNKYRGLFDEYSQQQFLAASKGYSTVISQQEDFLRQRAKIFWLQAGDKNSKYFHTATTAR